MTPGAAPGSTDYERELPTDYERDLTKIDCDIAELSAASPDDVEAGTKLAYRHHHRATLTGTGFALAERVAEDALRRYGPAQDLCLLRATLYSRAHRIGEARRELARSAGLVTTRLGRLLAADLDLQEGREVQARQAYERIVDEDPTWHVIARLAHLAATRGEEEHAERLYGRAEDELTAKQMRVYAWLRLQRGDLDLARGRHDAAAAHQALAARAYSGWWLTDQCRAALCAARGELDTAIALYRCVVARVPKPEISEAIGTLYARAGQPEVAAAWHGAALAEYRRSAGCGEVAYLHHLASFYLDVQPDPAEALRWARADARLRPNRTTLATLARALRLRCGAASPARG